ncbi:MAG: glycosyltransferase [Phycisphaerae bacterium]|nr:glycosyltransferase [Phycisphaerae bacterium]NUQ44724.1 glycosyltransferase [Phycisphaerae bacterium]
MPPAEMDLRGLHILLVPAWWPSIEQPTAGIFNVDYARVFVAAGAKVGVVFPDLVPIRHWRFAQGAGLIPRLIDEQLHDDPPIPVVRIRGLHAALRQPAIQMHRYCRWLRRGLARYVSQHGLPDVLHAHCAIPAGWAAVAVRAQWTRWITAGASSRFRACGSDPGTAGSDSKAGCPAITTPIVFITEHTGPFSLTMTPPAAGRFTLAALRTADAVVAVSQHLRQQMQAAGVDRPIEVIPNTIGTEFRFVPAPAMSNASDGRRIVHVSFVGRLADEKGVWELAEAAGQLWSDVQFAFHWRFIGDGPQRAALQERLASALPSDRVRFDGPCNRRHVAQALQESHMLVLPSHGETFGLAAAEALAVGRPVVATFTPGCEAIVGPDDGILCPVGRPTELANAIRNVAAEYARWDGFAMSQRAFQRFGPVRLVEAYARLIGQLVQRA